MTTVGAALQGVAVMGAAQLSAGQMAGALIATGVTAAIGDAAVQGLAIGFGAQSHFSFNEMLETGITAGVGLSMAGQAFTVDNTMRALMKVGVANVSAQLIEMGLGTRDKFDGRAALMQMSATVLSMGMNHLIPQSKIAPVNIAQQTFKKGQYCRMI